MDKIAKALQKLSAKELKRIKLILKKLSSNEISELDIKQLKGRSNIFRVRSGDIRIIYRKSEKNKIFVLAIARRNERTYKI